MFENAAVTFGIDMYAPTEIYVYPSLNHLLRANNFNMVQLNNFLEIPDDYWFDDETTNVIVPHLHIITSSSELNLKQFKRQCFSQNIDPTKTHIGESFSKYMNWKKQ
mgnify:FL=1